MTAFSFKTSAVAKQKGLTSPFVKTFTNLDLNSDKELIIAHKYNTKAVQVQVFDPNGIKISIDSLLQVSSELSFKIAFGGDLALGNYLLTVQFFQI